MRETIWYAGKELRYVTTLSDYDDPQAWLDGLRGHGREACCLHDGRFTLVYAEPPKP